MDMLRSAAERGLLVHLCYGRSEREASVGLLRYLLHPRFAMVCVFRALQEKVADQGADAEAPDSYTAADDALLLRAAQIGWEEAGVVLDRADVRRARTILVEAGLGRALGGQAKLEARNVPAYREAEAEYEECARLCRTL